MLRDVEAERFLLWRNAQTDDRVDDLQDDERGDDAEDPSDRNGHDLAVDHAAAFDQAELRAGAPFSADVPARARGEDAGQNRTERSADAVDAERVERIVVAELRLDLAASERTDECRRRRP